jgi:hypothetical protein
MSVGEWLTVGIFVVSIQLGVAGFLLRRVLLKVDKLDEAIYGREGVFTLLGLYVKREAHYSANAELAAQMEKVRLEYVKREVHDVANAELAAQMEKMRHEAMQREERIVEAIEKQADRNNDTVSKIYERIDRLRDSDRVGRRPS